MSVARKIIRGLTKEILNELIDNTSSKNSSQPEIKVKYLQGKIKALDLAEDEESEKNFMKEALYGFITSNWANMTFQKPISPASIFKRIDVVKMEESCPTLIEKIHVISLLFEKAYGLSPSVGANKDQSDVLNMFSALTDTELSQTTRAELGGLTSKLMPLMGGITPMLGGITPMLESATSRLNSKLELLQRPRDK